VLLGVDDVLTGAASAGAAAGVDALASTHNASSKAMWRDTSALS
jgi:hypothetical protein